MRYYLDTEFDGHNGPLISLALVRETGGSLYCVTEHEPVDPWVRENVCPLVLSAHEAAVLMPENFVGGAIRFFLQDDPLPDIVADSAVDIARFCRAMSTNDDGGWASFDGPITFQVHDVACYPTTLPGAVQHNAWWDAMALRHLLTSKD
jgi:hypothetical protein